MSTQQQETQQNYSISPYAYIFVMSGGGVVGTDYANWLHLDPFLGALIGGIISLALLNFAKRMYQDPGGTIKKKCEEAGIGIGILMGSVIIGINTNDDIFSWIIGGIIGAIIGQQLGKMAASLISFAGLGLLLLSQGPIGLALRTYILNSN